MRRLFESLLLAVLSKTTRDQTPATPLGAYV